MRDLARADGAILSDYGSSRGSLALRRILARRCADEGLDVAADQILLTSSATQAIDLICRLLLRPGDAVLVDDPCYFNFQAILRAHGARIVGIPYTPSGPDTALFGAALAAHRPRLYVTNSALHNPTGATMAPWVAHRLLNDAAAHDLTIVEDDIFAGFEPEPSPRLATYDGLSRVIRIGSFSKTLSASIRCGYVVARQGWIEALTDLQVATSFGGPSPVAVELIASTLADGTYRKHMEGLRRRLARTRRDVEAKLAAEGIRPRLMPRGGFYLWCELPDGRNAADVARAALSEKVILAPGDVFSPSRSATAFMRFNVAQMGDARVFDVLGRAISNAGRDGGDDPDEGDAGRPAGLGEERRSRADDRREVGRLRSDADMAAADGAWRWPCPFATAAAMPRMARDSGPSIAAMRRADAGGDRAPEAVEVASLALRGDGSHSMPLDNCIEAMRQTGLGMDRKFNEFEETSLGGLAVDLPGC